MAVVPCGMYDCDSCDHHAAARCPGCIEGNLQLQRRGLELCGIYNCAMEHKVETCEVCNEPSCEFARRSEFVCPLRAKFENKRWWAGRLARHLGEHGKEKSVAELDKISDRTIDRLRWYLVALDWYAVQGTGAISSWQLAQRVGVKAALIRKDLSRFGEFGTPSFGYDVKYLRKKILGILHLNEGRHVVWLGAQKLREQLAVLPRMGEHNCHLVAVLDPDPTEVGRKIADVQVLHLDSLAQVLANLSIDLAVIALPSVEAQKAATILAQSGVTAVLNLTPSLLVLPEHVTVRNVDVGGELLALSYYCGKGKDEAAGRKKRAATTVAHGD